MTFAVSVPTIRRRIAVWPTSPNQVRTDATGRRLPSALKTFAYPLRSSVGGSRRRLGKIIGIGLAVKPLHVPRCY